AEGDRARQGPAHAEGEPLRGGRVRAPAEGKPGLGAAAAGDRRGGHLDVRARQVTTITPPRERARRGTGSGTGSAWRVIVLNDDHNTFQGVAIVLARTLPGVDFDAGMR